MLTAQAAQMAELRAQVTHLTAENARLQRENDTFRAMQALIDAKDQKAQRVACG